MEDPRIFHYPTPHAVFCHRMNHLLETDLFTFAHFSKKSLPCDWEASATPRSQLRNFNQVASPGLVANQVAQVFADSRPNVSTPDRRSVCESDQSCGFFNGIFVPKLHAFER